MNELTRRGSCLLALSALCAASIPSLAQNAYSPPAAFVRLNVPAEGEVLSGMPVLPDNEDANAIFHGQMAGITNIGNYSLVKWDTALQRYVTSNANTDDPSTSPSFSDSDDQPVTLLPGDGFWVQNHNANSKDVFLMGQVLLDEQVTIEVKPGLNLFGHPYLGARVLSANDVDEGAGDAITSFRDGSYWSLSRSEKGDVTWERVDDSESRLASFLSGEGYFYDRQGSDPVNLTFDRPYENIFPESGGPIISSMSVARDGRSVTINVSTSGRVGEQFDIFYRDLGPDDSPGILEGWALADKLRPVRAVEDEEEGTTTIPSAVSYTDYGVGASFRPKVNRVFNRWYVAGSDLDTDGDELTDARETFLHGTDPALADTDGDGMDDKYELGHGLDPHGDDRLGDLDGDGISNWDEYRNGTDPRFARHFNAKIYVDSKTGNDLFDGRGKEVRSGEAAGPKATIRGAFAECIPGDEVYLINANPVGRISPPPGVKVIAVGKITVR